MHDKSIVDLQLVRAWVLEAGKTALSQQRDLEVQIKPDNTPITRIDTEIESFLLEQIAHQYPNHGVLAEEGSFRPGADCLWIIDPLDGTRAFASGLPVWGISVAIFVEGKPYAGVFYMPATGDMYWGSDSRAFHNESPLIPRSNVDLQSALAFFAVPSSAHRHYEISFPRLRSLGSMSAHFAYVAYGTATAALARPLRLWDIAALLPSLRVSRTALVYLSGEPFDPGVLLNGEKSDESLVAAHVSIIDEVRSYIRVKTKDMPRLG